eukprot:1023221-Prymnesium_polylepis.1
MVSQMTTAACVAVTCVLTVTAAARWLSDQDAACRSSSHSSRIRKLRTLYHQHRCAWIREDGGLRHATAAQSARSASRFVAEAAWPPTSVPVLDARALSPKRLIDAVRTAPMNAVLLQHAFSAAESLETVVRSSRAVRTTYSANNGRFPSPPACGRPAAPSRLAGTLRLTDLLASTAGTTDFNIFHAVPAAALSRRENCHGEFANGTVEARLMAEVLDAPGSRASGLAATLNRGHRQIFSAGRAGASVQFHEHAFTWFALTHGRKAWWLGPASIARQLTAYGGGASTCTYLPTVPDARVAFIVQGPGEILLFGEGVAHATCNLNASLGVGIQMGYTRNGQLALDSALHCTAERVANGYGTLQELDQRDHWTKGEAEVRASSSIGHAGNRLVGRRAAERSSSQCVLLDGELAKTKERRSRR